MQKSNPDLILIPGIESAPYYYWQGSVLSGRLKLINWHKHILVIGLDEENDIRNLPVVGNRRGLIQPFKLKDIFYLLWPILIMLAGVWCGKQGMFDYRYLYKRKLNSHFRILLIFSIFLIITGILFLINNYPYRSFRFNQYCGNLGILPYQNFIDYVNQHGGLTFWAHPEAEYIEDFGTVKTETYEHTKDLFEAEDYTGFAVFYEGYSKVGCPSCIWDEILLQYCKGMRKSPVWALAGLAFDATGDLNEYIKDLRVMLLLERLDKAEVLKALKEGRMYVLRGKDSSQFILDKFTVRDRQIQIVGHFLNGKNEQLKIKLIRNGSVIKTFEAMTPFAINYQDEHRIEDEKIYYRLEINAHNLTVITNPIFVKLK